MQKSTSVRAVPGVTASTGSRERLSPNMPQADEWKKLREAVDTLGWVYIDGKLDDHPINTVHRLVPQLMDAFADCFEMSMELTEYVKQHQLGQTKSGLVLPK